MSKVSSIGQMSCTARKIETSAVAAVRSLSKSEKADISGLPKELPLPDKHIEDIRIAELLDESLKYLNLRNDIINKEMEYKLRRAERKK